MLNVFETSGTSPSPIHAQNFKDLTGRQFGRGKVR